MGIVEHYLQNYETEKKKNTQAGSDSIMEYYFSVGSKAKKETPAVTPTPSLAKTSVFDEDTSAKRKIVGLPQKQGIFERAKSFLFGDEKQLGGATEKQDLKQFVAEIDAYKPIPVGKEKGELKNLIDTVKESQSKRETSAIKNFFDETLRFGARTVVNAANLIIDTANFTGDFIARNPEILVQNSPALKMQADIAGNTESGKYLKNKWLDFYKTTVKPELLNTKAKPLLNKINQSEYIMPSEDWDNASLKEKFTDKLGETFLIVGPGLIPSMAAFVVNPYLGFAVVVGSTAEDVKQGALENGVSEDKAELLGLSTGMIVAYLDKLVPQRLFAGGGKVKNKFLGNFVRRLADTTLLESGTEITQETIQMIAERTFREDLEWGEVATRLALSAFGGAIGGAGAQSLISMVNQGMKEDILQRPERKVIRTDDITHNSLTYEVLKKNTDTIPQELSSLSEEAKKYTSASDFAETQGTSETRQIGSLPAKLITARDEVDINNKEFQQLKESIQKDGIKEPVIVTVDQEGKLLTFDGSNRVTAAQQLNIDVPVIVTKGKVKGLQTIEEFYTKSKVVVNKPKVETVFVDKAEQSLIKKARKYKSAEEFVKSQGTSVYRGGTPFDKNKITNNGVALTTDKNRAIFYTASTQGPSGETGRIVNELVLDPSVKLATKNDIPAELWKSSEPDDIAQWAKKAGGYDGVDLRGLAGSIAQDDKEIRVFSSDVLKTKQQLTDIWDKAQSIETQSKPKSITIINPKKKVKKTTFTADDRKRIQEELQTAIYSGNSQEEAVNNIRSHLDQVLSDADSPVYDQKLKAVRAELKRSMMALVGGSTGNWKRDYYFLNKARANPEISIMIDTLEDGIFEIDGLITNDGQSSLGHASKGSVSVDEFEMRIPKEGTEQFKLFEKARALIRKYAQSIGEGYLPRNTKGVYYGKTKNIRVDSINNLSTVSHEIAHFLDYAYGISSNLLAVQGYTKTGRPIYQKEMLKFRKEITSLYAKYYPTGREDHPLRTRVVEGFATLLQKYVETPTVIEAEYPALVNAFLKKDGEFYQPVMGDILNDLNEIVADYQGLKSLDKIGARIATEGLSVDKKSFLGFFEKLRTTLVDDLYPIEVLAKRSKRDMTNQDPSLWLRAYHSVNSIINNNISTDNGYWTYDKNGVKKIHDFNWKNLVDLTVANKNTEDFAYYLVARREYFLYQDLDRLEAINKEVKAIEKEFGKIDEKKMGEFNRDMKATLAEKYDIDLSELSYTRAKKMIKGLVRQSQQELDDLTTLLKNDGFKRIDVDTAYNENQGRFTKEEKMFDILTKLDLDFLHNEAVQLIDNKQYNRLTSKEGYASFKRQFYDEITGDSEMMAGQARVGKTKVSSLMKRKGSTRTILNPLYSAILNHNEIMRKGMKQIVYNQIADIGVSAVFPNLFQELDLKVAVDKNTGAIIYPQEKDPDVIMGRKNFKRKPVLIDREVKGIIDAALTYNNIDVFVKLYTGLSRFFTAGTTGLYPPFTVTNFVRDQITAQANTENKYKILYSPLVQIGRLIADKNAADHKYYQEYLIAGGERQTFTGWQKLPQEKLFERISGERKGLEKAIAILEKSGSKTTDLLSAPAKYSELITRLSEYVNARKAGKSQIVALEEAGRLTAPFHHIGSWGGKTGQTFIRGLPFFNATLQVLDQHVRTLETPAGRKRMGAILVVITAAYLASMLQILKATDEQKEQYKDLHADDLAGFIYLPHPSGKNLIRIPMSETFTPVGLILNMIIADKVLDTRYTRKDYLAASTAIIPDQFDITEPARAFLSWVPQIFKAGFETIAGIKTWPEVTPLESMALKNLPPEMRANENTSVFAKWLGQKTGLSPIKIDYFITGYRGRAIGLVTGQPSAWDWGSSFVREYWFSNGRRVSGMYDMKERNDQQYNAYQKGLKEFLDSEVLEMYRVKVLTNDFSDLMTEYHKIDIEKNQEEAAKIRNEAIEIMNKIESGEKPKKFSDWVKKAKKRRKDAIKESTKNK